MQLQNQSQHTPSIITRKQNYIIIKSTKSQTLINPTNSKHKPPSQSNNKYINNKHTESKTKQSNQPKQHTQQQQTQPKQTQTLKTKLQHNQATKTQNTNNIANLHY